MERDAGRLSALLRFPIKGLSAEPLDVVRLGPDRPLPADRRFAFAEAGHGADRDVWLPKQHFVQLVRFPALAQITARVDLDAGRLQLFHPAKGKFAADLDNAQDRTASADWVAEVLGRPAGSLHLIDAGADGPTDQERPLLSLINAASVRALEPLAGRALDPRRFRGNLLVEGWPPEREFELVGRRLRIGAAELEVVERIDRCAATNVDPASGIVDANLPLVLRKARGHIDCGVFVRVSAGGRVAPGDRVRVL